MLDSAFQGQQGRSLRSLGAILLQFCLLEDSRGTASHAEVFGGRLPFTAGLMQGAGLALALLRLRAGPPGCLRPLPSGHMVPE